VCLSVCLSVFVCGCQVYQNIFHSLIELEQVFAFTLHDQVAAAAPMSERQAARLIQQLMQAYCDMLEPGYYQA